jgi:hypothetical protein
VKFFSETSENFSALLMPLCLSPPTNSGIPPIISNNRNFSPYFNHCLGALDGTHIVANPSAQDRSRYRNCKGFLSQNVLAVCSFDMQFMYVHAGWEGSAADATVLHDALNKDFIIPEGRFYLADAGYGISKSILTPYRSVRYHLRDWHQVWDSDSYDP